MLDCKAVQQALFTRATPEPEFEPDSEPHPESFACSGEISLPHPPSLLIQGIGEIPIPLSIEGAARLVATAEQAPYGLGQDTLINVLVRRTLQIDSAKVSCPANPNFFPLKVQALAADAAHNLGMDPDTSPVRAELHKLLFYEKGGHFLLHRDTEKVPGMFGSLILQLPTETGHQGGVLVVRGLRGEVKRFGFSSGFHYVAFFADCEHQVEPVTDGMRLCLHFNLVRQGPSLSGLPLFRDVHSPSFLAALSNTEAALSEWVRGGVERRKLAVALEHKYTKTNLCFSGLKGHDRVVVEVLRRCGSGSWLELHLCLVIKFKVFKHGELVLLEEGAEIWIGDDDKRREFPKLYDLGAETEVVMNREDLFRELHDKEDHTGFMGNYGPEDQYWYHSALVVAWPKSETSGIACAGGFTGALDMVDSKVKQKSTSEAAELFKGVVDYCNSNPRINFRTWVNNACSVASGEYTCRLLKLGLELGQTAQLFRLMDILQMHEGIASEDVARALAAVVKALGWETCSSAVTMLLRSDRFAAEASAHSILGFELQALGCHRGAVVVAKEMFNQLKSCSRLFRTARYTGKLLFSVAKDSVSAFVEFLISKPDETSVLCDVVVELKDSEALCFSEVRDSFSRLCWTILAGDLSRLSVVGWSGELVDAFLWFGDAFLLHALERELLLGDHQEFMKSLLKEEHLWDKAMETETGKQLFTALACGRINKLASKIRPVFSWRQPLAKLSEHPRLEAFLRGPKKRFTYTGCFGSFEEARRLARAFFDGKLTCGFSAKGEAGNQGGIVFCEIRKTKDAFSSIMKTFEEGLEELKVLRERLDRASAAHEGAPKAD